MAPTSRKRQPPRRKQQEADDLEIEVARRAAVEEVELFNVSIPEKSRRGKSGKTNRRRRGSEDLFNNSSEEKAHKGKRETPSPSPADSEDDTSFEDPYDFSLVNYDQFNTNMRTRCSKTYTYAKRLPPATKFDALLNKLNKEEPRDPSRPSHSYAPEEIESSDDSDEGEDFLTLVRKIEKETAVKPISSEEPESSVSFFDISDQAVQTPDAEPFADENVPPATAQKVQVHTGKQTTQKRQPVKSEKRKQAAAVTASKKKQPVPVEEPESPVSIFEISDQPVSTSTPEPRTGEDEASESSPPGNDRRGRRKRPEPEKTEQKKEVQKIPKRGKPRSEASSPVRQVETQASIFDVSISDQPESASTSAEENNDTNAYVPPPAKVRRGRPQKQKQPSTNVVQKSSVLNTTEQKPGPAKAKVARSSKIPAKELENPDSTSVFQLAAKRKTPKQERERDTDEEPANENSSSSPSPIKVRRSARARTVQKEEAKTLKVSKSKPKPKPVVTLPRKKATAGGKRKK